MTADRPIYEPEVEELLRELAVDPTSTLLRVPRKGVVPTLFDKNAMVSPRAAGLSSAERHLLQVYREDVELLLRQAYLLYCKSNEPFGPTHSWTITVDHHHELPAIEEWDFRAQGALGRPLLGDGAPEAHEVLAHCVRESPISVPSPVQLAAAALRLVPTNQARIYVASDLHLNGRIETGLRAFREVMAQCSSFHKSYCLQNMSRAYEDLGDTLAASRCVAEAALICGRRPDPLMNWLYVSIQRADQESALNAAMRIDELLKHDHEALVGFVKDLVERRRLGWWKPSSGARAFVLGIEERLGPASRSVANACH